MVRGAKTNVVRYIGLPFAPPLAVAHGSPFGRRLLAPWYLC